MAMRAQYSPGGIARRRAAAVTPTSMTGSGIPAHLAGPGGASVTGGAGSLTRGVTQTPSFAAPTAVNTPSAAPVGGSQIPTVDPYLTPAQIGSYSNAMSKDQGVIDGALGKRGTLADKFRQSSAVNGAKAADSFNKTNQGDAARGFAFSGIHDNAMADIQANAVMNQNNYNTAYRTGLATIASSVANAQNNIGQLGLEYSGIAGQNAQTLAGTEGGTVGANPYSLPNVAAPITPPAQVTPPPTTYFSSPNMGAINAAISSGAAAGTAAGG